MNNRISNNCSGLILGDLRKFINSIDESYDDIHIYIESGANYGTPPCKDITIDENGIILYDYV